MPIVEMPDGAHVEFPDDMPPDQIRSLIVGKFPELGQPQQQAPVQDKSMGAGIADIWNNPSGGPSIIGMARGIYEGVRGPGDALAGKFGHQPQTPGQWTEEDQFLADLGQRQQQEAAGNLAGVVAASKIPGVAMRLRTPANKIKSEGVADYKNVEANPATYGPEIRNALADQIQARVNAKVNREKIGEVGNRIDDIREIPPAVAPGAPPRDQMTMRELKQTREILNGLKTHPDPNVRKAAGIASDEILQFVQRTEPESGASLARGDANYAAAKKLEDLGQKSEIADVRGNFGNRTPGRALQGLLKPIVEAALKGNKRGWKADELQVMKDIVEGNNVFGKTSAVVKMAPFDLGKWAALPLDGLSNIVTKKQFDRLQELVQRRSPAYQDAVVKSAGKFFTAADEFVVQPSHSNLAKLVHSSRALSNGLVRDGIQITSGDLLRTIQGGKGAAAEDEQPEP